ncbi:MAG: HPr(Ser) kinase/phosphatase [Chthoniobacterales bacterium]|nr:HPr(Ser) kinase/phosphatase [Chthoniobacterales bacterium]
MPAAAKVKPISVGDFHRHHAETLGLELVAGERGLDRLIREPTVNRPGLALTGFYSYFAPKRVQVFGGAELSYLQSMPARMRADRLKRFFQTAMPCVVIARNAGVPAPVPKLAETFGVPVFRTPMITMKFINAATIALDWDFAPRSSEHGSMVDIHGIGTLIRGASGIGKSECVLSLLERGYSLVSDDITRFRSIEGRELVGRSAELTRFHMEVRGIGIINVASVFGVRSIRPEKILDLVVTLKDYREMEEVDRHGLHRHTYKILGISVPHVIIPVRSGRDLGRLVEVAALDQKLKGLGINSALEFNDKLIKVMQPKSE